ncbi:MAG: ABC transporter ATP-binding protein [Devosia sp.]
MAQETHSPTLEIRDLRITAGPYAVVDGVTLDVAPGEIVALVGESGSGKSLTALAIMGLLSDGLSAAGGEIRLCGSSVVGRSEAELRALRGIKMSMIFQEPVASLNPLMCVGEQVAESLIVHDLASPAAARGAAVDMLREVGIPEPERRALELPSQLSGGMCQRVLIAAALIAQPKLLIADEPTTALDVTIQAQILELMRRLRDRTGTSILIITHDMGVVAALADKVCVMYGGRIVEEAEVHQIFRRPAHPYTKLLLSTIPKLSGTRKKELFSIKGTVPDLASWPEGCRFKTRCPLADDACSDNPPLALVQAEAGHRAACWHGDRVGELP